MSQQLNRKFPAELKEAGRRLDAECGVVVYFRNIAGQRSMPNEQELSTQLSLQPRAEERDGVILSTSACRL
jgi:hypothetical protein